MTESDHSPSDDLLAGAFQFSQKENGGLIQVSAREGMRGFAVESASDPNQKAQMRVLLDDDIKIQDSFLGRIGSVIIFQRGEEIYPEIIDYGVDDGLSYYICDLDGYQPISELESLPIREATHLFIEFLEAVERTSEFNFDHQTLDQKSLWVGKNEAGNLRIVLADIEAEVDVFSDSRENNIANLIDYFRSITENSEQLSFEGEKPTDILQLKMWLGSQVPQKKKWGFLNRSKKPEQGNAHHPPSRSEEAAKVATENSSSSNTSSATTSTNKTSNLYADHNNLDSQVFQMGREAYNTRGSSIAAFRLHWWAFALVILLAFLLGHNLKLKIPSITSMTSRIDVPFSLVSLDTSSMGGKLSKYPQVMSFEEELELYISKAADARKGGAPILAMNQEMKAYKMAPNRTDIVERIRYDLGKLASQNTRVYSEDDIKILYKVAPLSPLANDIIVDYFRKTAARAKADAEAATNVAQAEIEGT